MKIGVTVMGFVLIFLSGYWLQHAGQPFNVIVLTLHKLISIVVIAYLILNVMRISRIAPLGQAAWIACIAVGVLFLLTIATGGWLSAVKTMPAFVRTLHHILPFLTALSTAVAFYLLLRKESGEKIISPGAFSKAIKGERDIIIFKISAAGSFVK